jgi:hypothetical protein
MIRFVLLIALLVGSATASAQVADERLTILVANSNTLSGVEKVKAYDDAGVIIFSGSPKIASCVVIKVTTEAMNVSIDVSDKDRNPTPYKQLDASTFYIDVPGKHWVDVTAIDFAKNIYVRKTAIAVVGPRPPPEPEPDPDPDDPDPPTPDPDVPPPIDGDGLRVLIVYESSELNQLTADQRDIFYGQTVRKYLTENCVQQDRYSEWRILDQDTSFVDAGSRWVKALARPRTSLPWILISNGKTGFEGPLPATPSETIELIKRYKQ